MSSTGASVSSNGKKAYMASQNINACGTVDIARDRPIPDVMTPTVGVAGAGAGAATTRCKEVSAAGQASTKSSSTRLVFRGAAA
jgi:hypothetical protein